MERMGEKTGERDARRVFANGKAFKQDSNLGNMSGYFQPGSLMFSQLNTGAKADFPLIV